ncbi:MAG: flagellar hook-associated protein FlgK [Alphaproteobacteria bacterium]|nr:flagellar hook-associated protein FlgK [Alphaproteobacteria bacterium]
MSLTSALSVALSGIQASTAAAQIISANVANAQTEGYTAKSVTLTTKTNGSFTGGVEITGYARKTNTVLSEAMNGAITDTAYLSTQDNYLTQIQAILDSSNDPPALSSCLSEFQSAWTEYASNPSDSTLEQTVVSSAQNMAGTIRSIGTEVASLKLGVQDDLSNSVDALNAALVKIQELNGQIAVASAKNQATVNLEDSRDTLISEIASYTRVTVMQRDNQQIALYTPNGMPLLDVDANSFSVSADGTRVLNQAGSYVSENLEGGSIEAQINFLASNASEEIGVGVLTKIQSQIQNFVNMFVAETTDSSTSEPNSFASIYNSAATDSGEEASDFFSVSFDADGLPDLTSFEVNANLATGITSVKTAAANDLSDLFLSTSVAITTSWNSGTSSYEYTSGTTFDAEGLVVENRTYSGIATAILSYFQQVASTTSDRYATASTQETYYKSAMASDTGVNTDEELINLTAWENSYAASAHVVSTIQEMMNTLINIVD